MGAGKRHKGEDKYNTTQYSFIEKIDKPQFKNNPTEILQVKVKNT